MAEPKSFLALERALTIVRGDIYWTAQDDEQARADLEAARELQRDLDLAVLEAREDEARWWNDGMHHAEGPMHHVYCPQCIRLADLQKQKAELLTPPHPKT
jgi:hypothetical protein